MAQCIFQRSVAPLLSLLLALPLATTSALRAQSPDLPRLEDDHGTYRLIVDGKPYFILGAQVHNSSGWPESLRAAWPALQAIHCNTVMIPVYWEAIEPKEGTFDFSTVDAAVDGARKAKLRLALLWFGTWKNGAMTYVPEWLKDNPAKYRPVIDPAGNPVDALTPLSDANRQADRTAFAALMRHLKNIDGSTHTVIMVQVENEAGVLGADRDYSPEATARFQAPVPREVLATLSKSSKPGATWSEVFAERAPEAFMSYWTARYIDSVAAAGKVEYPLPMYINVWPREQPGLVRPGFSSPSGGAVAYLLPLWKHLAPHIDVIGGDNYDDNEALYRQLLALYNRPDNPLFVPETGGSLNHAKNMFFVFEANNALGVSAFGVDGIAPEDLNRISGPYSEIAFNYALIGPAASEWMRLREHGDVQVAVEEEGDANPALSFSNFDVAVRFGPVRDGYGGPRGQGNARRNGRVIVGQLAPDEFLISGMSANIVFAPKLGAREKNTMYLSVEEGHFENSVWHTDRLLNGDETAFGLGFPARGETLKVKVRAY